MVPKSDKIPTERELKRTGRGGGGIGLYGNIPLNQMYFTQITNTQYKKIFKYKLNKFLCIEKMPSEIRSNLQHTLEYNRHLPSNLSGSVHTHMLYKNECVLIRSAHTNTYILFLLESEKSR